MTSQIPVEQYESLFSQKGGRRGNKNKSQRSRNGKYSNAPKYADKRVKIENPLKIQIPAPKLTKSFARLSGNLHKIREEREDELFLRDNFIEMMIEQQELYRKRREEEEEAIETINE